jgi:peptidoglycan hydrolase-like protein with peptidoglycan-binding domain
MKKSIAALAVLLAVTGTFVGTSLKADAAAPQERKCTQAVFRKGSYDRCVRYIQQMLNAHAIVKPSLAVDSDFGPKTKAAVLAWQDKQQTIDSNMLVDGIVGPQTWKMLCKYESKYPQIAKNAGCNPQPKPNTADTDCTKQVFSIRTSGTNVCVGYIQHMLKLAGNTTLITDDKFSTKTKAAVTAWQKQRSIRQDGIVGTQTWKTLCSYKTPPPQSTQDVYTVYARLAGCKR